MESTVSFFTSCVSDFIFRFARTVTLVTFLDMHISTENKQ